MRETDLFDPVKKHLEQLGYEVKAEVGHVDVMAVKDTDILLIEMKKVLSFKVLYQALNRQHLFDYVYIAILHPGMKSIKKSTFKEKLYILKRLGLGLLLVDIETQALDVVLEPVGYALRKKTKKKKALLKEFQQRHTKKNIGGSTQQKIMTAYREQTILIARTLIEGPRSTKEIKALSGIGRATNILYKNYYRWFHQVKRGVYELTDLGFKEIQQYNDILKDTEEGENHGI